MHNRTEKAMLKPHIKHAYGIEKYLRYEDDILPC